MNSLWRSPPTPPPAPKPAVDVQKFTASQVAEWDAQMQGLDKQQENALSNQWNLLRTQMGTLMRAMAEMNGVVERVTFLEDFIGESADKHRAMEESRESLSGRHRDLASTMETRLEYLEGLIGDSSLNHKNEIKSAMSKLQDMHAAISACAKTDHTKSLEKRMDFLEKELGESADKHDKHKTSMEERVEFVETKLGDSAEKHWKEIQAAKTKLGDLHQAVSQCAKQEHHSSLEKRMAFVEKGLGESADKHDKHKTSIEERMEFLEAKVGDSAEKHWKEIQAAKSKLGDVHQAVSKCAKQEHHSTLEKRVAYIEKALGESADKHDKHKTSVEERMEFLEAKIGDTAENHWKEIEEAKGKLGDMHKAVKECAKLDHASSLDKRLGFLEGCVGDNADKHAKALQDHADRHDMHWKEIQDAKTKLGDFSQTLAQCAKKEHHSTLEKRMAFVEKELGESADKHDKHKTSMEDRMEFLETKMGDSAEKHWKEIQAAKEKLGDVHQAVSQCAKVEHHSSLEKRMAFVEKTMGESADKHDQHKTSVEDRMEFLESKIGDSAEKHWKEIQAAKEKLGDLHQAVSQCAKTEHHSSLEKRMAFVEKAIGESADKHDQHKTSVEDRMEFLEAKIGDSAEKHWKEIEAAKSKLGDIHKAVKDCAQLDHASSLDKRLAFVEKAIGESADKHDQHKTTVEERMEFLEAKIGDSAEKHWKEIEAAKSKLGDIHKAVKDCAQLDHASSLDKRLGFLENMVGDNADKHAKDLKDHKSGFQEHKESMDTRLEFLEALIGDSADKHAKEIDSAKKKLGTIEAAVSSCAKVEHHSSMERRMDYLEKILGDSADDHLKHKGLTESRLAGAERLLKEFGISLDSKGHKSDLEKLEGIVLAGIDKRLTDVEEKHLQDFIHRLNDYERKHMQDFEQIKSRFGDIDKALKECANIEHYIGLDKKHGVLSQRQAEIAEIVKESKQDVDGKIDAQKVTLESVKSLLEQRLRQFEGKLGELYRGNEFMKDVEQRFNYMEDDQKRARDMLESSILEQLRLEHSNLISQVGQMREQCDLEERARQTYEENYKHLLGQERSAREAQETHVAQRIENFERNIQAELMRSLQSAIQSQASQMQEQWNLEQRARQTDQVNYKTMLAQEKNARETNDVQLGSRFENFERSMTANIQRVFQADMANYKALLVQEKSSREAHEIQLGSRFENFERTFTAQLQRVWQELAKEAAAIASRPTVVQERVVQQLPSVVVQEVAAPVTVVGSQQYRMSPGIAARPASVQVQQGYMSGSIAAPQELLAPSVVEVIETPVTTASVTGYAIA